jgi:hypothetical protein
MFLSKNIIDAFTTISVLYVFIISKSEENTQQNNQLITYRSVLFQGKGKIITHRVLTFKYEDKVRATTGIEPATIGTMPFLSGNVT